mmetsp:Transcript_16053/g.2657  ORF Transcript_16053/g.2657 Transcript_16053/m.2657 type:complete len:89 (+) Transcript_16053:547-813(+)
MKKFPPSSIVVSQDERPKGIFFIYTGSVNLIRKVKFRDVKGGDIQTMAKTPNYFDRVIEFPIVLDELGTGEMFCDYDFLHKNPMQYSV